MAKHTSCPVLGCNAAAPPAERKRHARFSPMDGQRSMDVATAMGSNVDSAHLDSWPGRNPAEQRQHGQPPLALDRQRRVDLQRAGPWCAGDARMPEPHQHRVFRLAASERLWRKVLQSCPAPHLHCGPDLAPPKLRPRRSEVNHHLHTSVGRSAFLGLVACYRHGISQTQHVHPGRSHSP